MLQNPLNLILLLFLLVAIFHLMFVWPRNLDKITWKKVDYAWLAVASLGVISLATEARISIAKNWVKIEEIRAVSILENIENLFSNPEQSHFCMTFSRSEYSPSDFDVTVKEYEKACKWRKQFVEYMQSIDKEALPPIRMRDVPNIDFNDVVLNESVMWLENALNYYETQLSLYNEVMKSASIIAGKNLYRCLRHSFYA